MNVEVKLKNIYISKLISATYEPSQYWLGIFQECWHGLILENI